MVDALLKQADKENCVDMLRCIHSLRRDRPSMVQTEVIICILTKRVLRILLFLINVYFCFYNTTECTKSMRRRIDASIVYLFSRPTQV